MHHAERFTKPSTLAALALAVLLAFLLVGWAAANTVSASKVGEGTGTTSGYNISNVIYTLNDANPSDLDQVDFDLDSSPPVGSTIRAKLVAAGNDWYACTNVSVAVTCVTTSPQELASTADELRAVVAQ